MKSILGLAVLLLLPAAAWSADDEQTVSVYQDKPRSYVGANLVYGALDFDSRDDTINPAAFAVRMGGMANDHFGLEARFGTGLGKTTERPDSTSRAKVDYSLDHVGGVYFTARAPLLDFPRWGKVYTQGYLGVGAEQIKTVKRACDPDCRSDTERNDETGPSWGVALGLRPRPEVSLAVEYMRYVSTDEIEVSGLEAGILYHF